MHRHKRRKTKIYDSTGKYVSVVLCKSCGEILDPKTLVGTGEYPPKTIKQQKRWAQIRKLFGGNKDVGMKKLKKY